MLTVEPGPRRDDLLRMLLSPARVRRDGNIRFVGSGKAGLHLVFGYLQKTGVLKDKMAPVMVPPWLGTWVYNELLPFGFPTLLAPDAKVALVYHQYGFPQNLDRVLDMTEQKHMVVVEDCAHACGGLYKGRPLGSFGKFAIYSFSKFVFCFALGGVASLDQDFYGYVEDEILRSSSLLRLVVSAIKLFTEASVHSDRPIATTMADRLTKTAYALYGDQLRPGMHAISLWLQKKEAEIAARRSNYALLRRETSRWGLCDHLEDADVVPYAVPLAIAPAKAAAVAARLHDVGIQAAIRRFDFARCMFEPDYRQSLLVPIHSHMTGKGMDVLVSCLAQTL
jgi:hypothetical protein